MDVDEADMISRLRRVMPSRWFGDVAPFTDAVLGGIGTAYVATYALVQAVRQQARLATADSVFLEMFSGDFFGSALPRRGGEGDSSFRRRMSLELLRPRCTRGAMINAMTQLTGQPVVIFEPARPADTGSYNLGGAGYGVAGGWGNLSLPFQSFIIAGRPKGGGIGLVAGYGSGGPLCYGNLSTAATAVTDADIYASAAATLPVGYTAWVQIHS